MSLLAGNHHNLSHNHIVFVANGAEYYDNLAGDERIYIFRRDVMNIYLEQYEERLGRVTYDDIVCMSTLENYDVEIADLPMNLRVLYMMSSMCRTLTLSPTVRQSIQSISIDHARMSVFPDISGCPKLSTINIMHCQLRQFPMQYDLPPNLTNMDITSNLLTTREMGDVFSRMDTQFFGLEKRTSKRISFRDNHLNFDNVPNLWQTRVNLTRQNMYRFNPRNLAQDNINDAVRNMHAEVITAISCSTTTRIGATNILLKSTHRVAVGQTVSAKCCAPNTVVLAVDPDKSITLSEPTRSICAAGTTFTFSRPRVVQQTPSTTNGLFGGQNVHLTSVNSSMKKSFDVICDYIARNSIVVEPLTIDAPWWDFMFAQDSRRVAHFATFCAKNKVVSEFLAEQFNSEVVNTITGKTYKQTFEMVWSVMIHLCSNGTVELADAMERLTTELMDSIGYCFTGKYNRLFNSLVGILDGVRIGFSSAEETQLEIGKIIERFNGDQTNEGFDRAMRDAQGVLVGSPNAESWLAAILDLKPDDYVGIYNLEQPLRDEVNTIISRFGENGDFAGALTDALKLSIRDESQCSPKCCGCPLCVIVKLKPDGYVEQDAFRRSLFIRIME